VGAGDGEIVPEVELDACVAHDLGECRPRVSFEEQVRRQPRDALADKRLRRRREQDRLLDEAALSGEAMLLAAPLHVMARVRLVDRQHEELVRRHRQVDVDRDPAAPIAEVVAGRPPRAVVHGFDDDLLAGREVDQTDGPRACLVNHPLEQLGDALRGHEGRALPPVIPLRRRPVAGEETIEVRVRLGEDRFVRVRRAHAVAALHLVRPRRRLAGEDTGVGPQAADLVAQPAALQLGEKLVRLGDERTEVGRPCVDLRGELRRTEVRVDGLLDVATEREPEPDVAFRERRTHGRERTPCLQAARAILSS
jgi:hypothetical protein